VGPPEAIQAVLHSPCARKLARGLEVPRIKKKKKNKKKKREKKILAAIGRRFPFRQQDERAPSVFFPPAAKVPLRRKPSLPADGNFYQPNCLLCPTSQGLLFATDPPVGGGASGRRSDPQCPPMLFGSRTPLVYRFSLPRGNTLEGAPWAEPLPWGPGTQEAKPQWDWLPMSPLRTRKPVPREDDPEGPMVPPWGRPGTGRRRKWVPKVLCRPFPAASTIPDTAPSPPT